MTHLRFDVSRCRPARPDSKCHNCKRWADHPEQVFGHVTALVFTVGSKDAACMFRPISLQQPEMNLVAA